MATNKPLTIIIADDDEDDRELLRFLFNQHEQFELLGCLTSGIEVLDEIINKRNVPDILLIDMYMPFLTGMEVVKELNDNSDMADMHKFIISTTINNADQENYRNDSHIKFLKKPVSLTEINDLPGIILENLNRKDNMRV